MSFLKSTKFKFEARIHTNQIFKPLDELFFIIIMVYSFISLYILAGKKPQKCEDGVCVFVCRKGHSPGLRGGSSGEFVGGGT